ncbi:MAG: hypothetical protein MUP45_02235 [Candidatus Marinimicrobia bacterium]|nr:hypothetical protein [Candidatus Neomarinimicrobiota bacterium]
MIKLIILLCFLALIWVFVDYFVSRKYIVLTKDLESDLLLKVKDGQVMEVNDRFWKEKGFQYCPVSLPEIEEGKFTVETQFTYETNNIKMVIEPSLTCSVPQDNGTFVKGVPRHGFVPQELFDHVVLPGYSGVSEMILDHFEGAVEATREIGDVLAEPSLNFFKLLSAYASALNWLKLGRPLSNLTKIELNLNKEDISTIGMIVFPPRNVEIVCLGEEEDEQ